MNNPNPPMPPDAPTDSPAKGKEHWLVEVVGGMTLASTMVSALSLWALVVMFALPISS